MGVPDSPVFELPEVDIEFRLLGIAPVDDIDASRIFTCIVDKHVAGASPDQQVIDPIAVEIYC